MPTVRQLSQEVVSMITKPRGGFSISAGRKAEARVLPSSARNQKGVINPG